MIISLPEPNEKCQDPREEYVDGPLRVSEWWMPNNQRTYEKLPDGAPSWWTGEAAASDAFLKAVGVRVKDGQVVPR